MGNSRAAALIYDVGLQAVSSRNSGNGSDVVSGLCVRFILSFLSIPSFLLRGSSRQGRHPPIRRTELQRHHHVLPLICC